MARRDAEGEVLDVLVQSKRNKHAAFATAMTTWRKAESALKHAVRLS